jgi:hypothetical protein
MAMTTTKLLLVCALSLSAAGCAAYPRYTAMVEVPNAPVPPHPLAPPSDASDCNAEDRAAAVELAATGAQAALEILFAIAAHH